MPPLHMSLDHFNDIYFFFHMFFGFVCLRRTKEQKGGGIGQQPERNEMRLSFSRRLMSVRQFSTADVMQTYTPLLRHPPSPSSLFCPSYLVFLSASCFRTLRAPAHSGHFSFYIFSLFFSFLPSHFSAGAPLLLLSILSVEMSGWREAVPCGVLCHPPFRRCGF